MLYKIQNRSNKATVIKLALDLKNIHKMYNKKYQATFNFFTSRKITKKPLKLRLLTAINAINSNSSNRYEIKIIEDK